jgi:hypothetical protein
MMMPPIGRDRYYLILSSTAYPLCGIAHTLFQLVAGGQSARPARPGGSRPNMGTVVLPTAA